MFWIDLLFALVIALLLGAVVAGGFRWRHPGTEAAWTSGLFIFFLIFFAAWAGGVWLTPAAATVAWGSYWVPFFIVGLFVVLLVAAIPGRRRAATPAEGAAAAGAAVFGLFFWLLLIGLILAIIAGYYV